MLGTPAEVYNFGAQYWIIVIAMALSSTVVATVYLPVFTKLQVTSSYEVINNFIREHCLVLLYLFMIK